MCFLEACRKNNNNEYHFGIHSIFLPKMSNPRLRKNTTSYLSGSLPCFDGELMMVH
jgi:hypothetical protein